MGDTPLQVRPDIVPTEASVRSTASYAPQMRVVHDATGFVIYFFSVSPDILDDPEVQTAVKKTKPDEGGVISLRMIRDAVAKLYVPADAMPGFIEALTINYALWRSTQGRRDK